MLGSPILYLKGMRILMFQLSGFYCRPPKGLNRRRAFHGRIPFPGPKDRELGFRGSFCCAVLGFRSLGLGV